MNNILTLFKQNENISDIFDKLKDKTTLLCSSVTENIAALLISSVFSRKKDIIIYVCENMYKANIAYDNLCEILGSNNVNLYLSDDFSSVEAYVVNNELKIERMNTLLNIYKKNYKIIVTDVNSLSKPLQSQNRFYQNIIKFKKNEEINVNDVIRKLTILGYKKVSTTYSLGQYSVRGEVIDVFANGYNEPIRINIGFDEVEDITSYDVQTQLKTNEKHDEVIIFPMNEIALDFDIDSLQRKINIDSEYIIDDFIKIKELDNYDKLLKYMPYIDENHESLFDYVKSSCENYITFYRKINELEKINEKTLNEVNEYKINRVKTDGLELLFYYDFNKIKLIPTRKVLLNTIKNSLHDLQLYGLYEFDGYKVTNYEGDIKYLLNDLKTKTNLIYIAYSNEKQIDLLLETLNEEKVDYTKIENFFDTKPNKINFIKCDNAIAYGIHNQYEVITDSEIFKNAKIKKVHYKSVKETSTQINSKDDLQIGDYVVHFDYGIGKYIGVQTVELNNIKNDYLKIQYENIDLLILMEKITDLEKYLGAEGVVPKLTKVGTNEWEKKKQIVRGQLESIAKNLINLQVERQNMKGYKYPIDSDLQIEFENDFGHEPTNDQITIVKEIKKEMEDGVLIDRLVCGDVGFGKTEIAMRIAFKTVYSGKQVAYMAPTTILTRQHYVTFKERFEKYGIKVELINRLIDPKKQKQIINDLKEGKIDIIIGTHRLLNSEISYKDLGLLIIDEEQRFGVTHKEKIKQIKHNINVLTLTATPIPRTLQMSVSGIRTLSLLETPPKDRYPIQTYVLEYNETVIKEAIYRELARDGQVFYLHNRISDLEKVKRQINKLVPEAKICIGHGKMTKEELEDVIQSYIDKEYNVLICTTIIETGIDIPNSNTLIVDDATRLGLAQMYQIRGRVGRMNKIAYAYFLHQVDKVLTNAAEKRLSAIKEYTRIGSGYKIAVRDLAIRGAGDILGIEQSGFINSIGMDMYIKLLNEAVNKAKGIEEKPKINYNIEVSKHVEKEYVSDESIRIYIHKEINSINNLEEKNKVISQLENRFGKLSNNILIYIEEKYLESQLRYLNVVKAKEEKDTFKITLPKEVSNKLRGDRVMYCAYQISKNIVIMYKNDEYEFTILKENNNKNWIFKLTTFLEKIIKEGCI